MFILAIFVFIFILIVILFFFNDLKDKKYIYSILITNNDSIRSKFIPIALKNFNIQSYEYKHLLIINHGNSRILNQNNNQKNYTELMVEKKNLTLGELRNIALNLIPLNSYWVTYDDDDVRLPQYFSYLMKHIKGYDAVFLKNRFDYNLNNNFIYKCRFLKGMPLIFAKNIIGLKYLNKDTLEDVNLQNDLTKLGKKWKLLDNDPLMYIRTLHSNNTSTYVNKEKNDILNYHKDSDYKEYYASKNEIMTVVSFYNSFLLDYYSDNYSLV